MGEEVEVEVIERLIDRCNACKLNQCENCEINWTEVQAIYILLERYKVQRRQLNDAFDRGWIHKDKLREKIEYIDNYAIYTNNTQLNWQLKIEDTAKIEVLKELLEE